MVNRNGATALAGFGVHGDGVALPPGWQLSVTMLLYPLKERILPLNVVCWLGKMGPPMVPPLGLEMEIEKSGGRVTITVPCIAAWCGMQK